jgi:hypothetical protein
VADLALDLVEERGLQVLGRRQELAVLALGPEPGGQVVEQLGQVAAQDLVAGEQAEVGVLPGGAGVVVAGGDVGVAAQAVVVLAHDQDQLAVGLQADDAVGDVDAGPLHAGGPADVGLLVEASLELEDDRDLLAAERGVDQVLDDLRVARGPVQRGLDRADLGIAGGLAQEPLDRLLKRLVGVMDQDAAGVADGVEDRALAEQVDRRTGGRGAGRAGPARRGRPAP